MNNIITPMFIIEMIANRYDERIISTIDKDYNICIYINNIDKIKKKKYISNLEGRGLTYKDACIDYINNVLNTDYCIRYKKKFYATTPIRNIVKAYMNSIKQIEEKKDV